MIRPVLGLGLCLWIWFSTLMIALPGNCDLGWLAYATDQWLKGQTLYANLYEVNPPWIFYLMASPIWIASQTGIDGIVAHKIATVVVATFSAILVGIIWRKITIKSQPTLSVLRLCLGTAIAMIYYLIAPGNMDMFGQREHWFMIMIAPYIMISIPSLSTCGFSKRFHVLIAGCAAIGLLLKPHFFAIWLAVELFHYPSERKIKNDRRIYVITPLLAGLFYIVYTYAAHPEFFSELLPLALQTYDGHRFPPESMIKLLSTTWHPLALFWIITAATLPRQNRRIHYYFFSLMIAATLTALLQFKGWYYTALPLTAISIIYLGIVLDENIRPLLHRRSQTAIMSIGTTTLTLAVACVLLLPFSTISFLASTLFFSVLMLVITYGFHLLRKKKSPSVHQFISLCLVLLSLALVMPELMHVTALSFAALSHWVIAPLLFGCMFMLWLWQKPAFTQRYLLSHRAMRASAALCIIAVMCIGFQNKYDQSRKLFDDAVFKTIKSDILHLPLPRRVYIFNIGIHPAFPIVNYTQSQWTSRFHQLWMVPDSYDNPDKCEFAPAGEEHIRWLLERMISDFRKTPPDIVFFDTSPVHFFRTEEHFDFIKCLSHFPMFSEWLAEYELSHRYDFCTLFRLNRECSYTVWKRKKPVISP